MNQVSSSSLKETKIDTDVSMVTLKALPTFIRGFEAKSLCD